MLIIFAACGLLFLSMVVTASPSPAPPSFAGKWKLQTESPNVPPGFMAMNVSQTASELKVDLDISYQPEGFTPGTKYQTRLYDLSGKETVMYEDHDPRKIAATLSAESQADGKMLLKFNRLTTDRGVDVIIRQKSLWELTAGGELNVTQFIETPEAGEIEAITLHFVKE